jgi:hypothetical protein
MFAASPNASTARPAPVPTTMPRPLSPGTCWSLLSMTVCLERITTAHLKIDLELIDLRSQDLPCGERKGSVLRQMTTTRAIIVYLCHRPIVHDFGHDEYIFPLNPDDSMPVNNCSVICNASLAETEGYKWIPSKGDIDDEKPNA